MEANLFTIIKILAGWFMLEQHILKFAAGKGRKIVLVSECVRIADRQKISGEILEAALLYFHSLNVFLYCPQVLPGLVFINPQVLFNCVYELVAFLFKMSCGAAMGVVADDSAVFTGLGGCGYTRLYRTHLNYYCLMINEKYNVLMKSSNMYILI